MALPPTYYDFIKKNRPYVIELAEQDARDLLNSSDPPETVHSVDDYQSRFEQCINQVDAEMLWFVSQTSGVSEEQLKSHLNSMRSEFAHVYNAVTFEFHCAVNFALAGKKTFHFTDNLADHLANTEINVKSELIRLPFRSCLFTFTSRSVINAMHNIRGDAGRWDMNINKLDYNSPVSVFLTEFSDEGDERRLVMCAWQSKLPETVHLMLKRELYLNSQITLEQSLRTDWENKIPDETGNGLHISVEDEFVEKLSDETFYTDGLMFFRIILNAILYLSSDKPELKNKKSPRKHLEAQANNIKSRPKRVKALRSARNHSELDYDELGSSFGPIVVLNEGEDENIHSEKKTGSAPKLRFMVRGHWRRQPYGPESKERKLIWIMPHFKGPDIAKAINKPYLVKKNRKGEI